MITEENITRKIPGSSGGRSQSLFDCVEKSLRISIEDFTDHDICLNEDNIVEYGTLPNTCRGTERRAKRLNTQLLQAVRSKNDKEIENLLKLGAHADATCSLDLVSACHIAAMSGGNALSLLLQYGAQKDRVDRLGRTPLHLAAWVGNVKQLGILLGLPEDLSSRIDNKISEDEEGDIRKLSSNMRNVVDVRCEMHEVHNIPKPWLDSIEHECKILAQNMPTIHRGWTPLHAASSAARHLCTKLLLLAGADPKCRDVIGRTALDVVGNYFYYGLDINAKSFTEVIKQLVPLEEYNCLYIHPEIYDTPLHTAVELECLEAIAVLIKAGASVRILNRVGLTPMHLCVKKNLKEHLQVLANYLCDDKNNESLIKEGINVANVKDKDGNTILHFAVLKQWAPGVCIALETGVDLLDKNDEGETAIHLAAALGDLQILTSLLNLIQQRNLIDYPNESLETPLFKAVINGKLICVKKLLKEGASIEWMMPKGYNIFHVAAEKGHKDILKTLLNHDYRITRKIINFTTYDNKKGYGAIHFAVINNHPECVKLLLSSNAYVSLRAQFGLHWKATPLHIAAEKNLLGIAKILVKFDKSTIHNVNDMGWSPLHTACYNRSIDLIKYLVQEGADLSLVTKGPNKFKKTPIDIIVTNLSKPVELLEEIFDMNIYCNKLNLQNPECEVTVDYNVLMPNYDKVKQITVIESLLETGNRYGTRRILLHPLLESFLYLKWKALLPFVYTTMVLYGLFVTSLTVFTVSTFFYKDTEEMTPKWLDVNIWKFILYFTAFMVIVQEILYINITKRVLLQLDTWVKFSSLSLAIIVPHAIEMSPIEDWPRHIATMALLFSWLELMFLLARIPNCGYYVLMFRKVSANVIKILLTFAFLVIGFSLSFMVQFHSRIPFESPWAALVKTMVMMTSEFDYNDLVNDDIATSLIIIRITFLTFLILAAIVLMNLMVGVAVNDLHDLEVLGNIRRLEKQVEFLNSLETLVFNSFIDKILPKKLKTRFEGNIRVSNIIVLRPNDPFHSYYKVLPPHIRDRLFEKIKSKTTNSNNDNDLDVIKNSLNEIRKHILNSKLDSMTTVVRNKTVHDIRTRIDEIDSNVRNTKTEMSSHISETKTSIEVINVKIDLILSTLLNK